MLKEIYHVLRGYSLWIRLKWKYKIDHHKTVLVLPEDYEKLNYYALAHLENWLNRKSGKEAIILTTERPVADMVKRMRFLFPVQLQICSREEIETLYIYYCFDKFFDNIVFLYLNKPSENLMHRVLEETSINEEEAVCLGFYCLRHVPKIEEPYRGTHYV